MRKVRLLCARRLVRITVQVHRTERDTCNRRLLQQLCLELLVRHLGIQVDLSKIVQAWYALLQLSLVPPVFFSIDNRLHIARYQSVYRFWQESDDVGLENSGEALWHRGQLGLALADPLVCAVECNLWTLIGIVHYSNVSKCIVHCSKRLDHLWRREATTESGLDRHVVCQQLLNENLYLLAGEDFL